MNIYCFFFLLAGLIPCTGCSSMNSASSDSSSAPAPEIVKHASKKTLRKIPFAPTYHAKGNDSYLEAEDIYSSSQKPSQGVYYADGLVFVVVVIDNSREKLKHVDGTAMLRADALLRRDFPGLPKYFSIDCRILEEEMDDEVEIYRYVLAYRKSDILDCCRNDGK